VDRSIRPPDWSGSSSGSAGHSRCGGQHRTGSPPTERPPRGASRGAPLRIT